MITEEPLEIRVAGPGHPARRVTVTMRTPGHDFELAAGWLQAEGVVASADEIAQVAYCTDADLTEDQRFNVVTVTLRVPPRRLPERGAATSACGVCGADSLDEVYAAVGDRAGSGTLPLEVALGLPDAMRDQQTLFDRTGGIHAAGLWWPESGLAVVREDIGRHNAVDKAFGCALLERRAGSPALVVSSRIGFEIVQKAVAGGAFAVVAVGAPSSLAVDLARRTGLAMAGWARGDRLVAYSVPENFPA